MASQFLDLAGLTHYDGKIKEKAAGTITLEGQTVKLKAISGAVIGTFDIPNQVFDLASSTQNGLMSSAHFNKLEGIAEGATKVEASDVNGKVKINGLDTAVYTHTTGAEQKEAALVKVTTDTEGHVKTVAKVEKGDIVALGIPAQDTTYEDATALKSGLLSAEGFKKLEGIKEGATKVANSSQNGNILINDQETQVYVHAKHTNLVSGLYKVTVDAEGHVTAGVAVQKADITKLGIPAQDTTYQVATGVKEGLMSAAHFTKLEGVEAKAQVNKIEKISVDGSPLPINSKGVNIDLSGFAKKTDITGVYKFKGSVDTFENLPKEGQQVGDTYDVKAAHLNHPAGTNFAWDGEQWDALGGSFHIDAIQTSEIDKLFA